MLKQRGYTLGNRRILLRAVHPFQVDLTSFFPSKSAPYPRAPRGIPALSVPGEAPTAAAGNSVQSSPLDP